MKTSTTTPRTPRKASSTVAKATPTEKKVTAPRARRVPTKKSPAIDVETPVPAIDLVRVRAYEIYEHRSGQGDAVSDWLQAEQELMAKAG
jgi:Protein of unknown function (DUF2934)